MRAVLRSVDANFAGLVGDLRTLIRQPSISAKHEGIEECALLVSRIMKKSGINTQILRLGRGVPPVVFGEVRSKTNPGRTLLFYNHYDVQPAEPFELWNGDPFSGKVVGNKIFGRGSSDDKGELMTRIKAVESFLNVRGDVPCNIKFLVEGEEEIGSQHIEQYLKKYRTRFSADAVIWEFGYVDSKGRPVVGLGMKGLLYVELSVREASRDAHSSLAVIIKNPAWRLVEVLKTLRNPSGRILIKGWYEDVLPFSRQDLHLLRKEPLDERAFKEEYGVREFVNGKSGLGVKKALAGEPTCNIAGIVSGYTMRGAKTVLPAEAVVKIDFRLVPMMDPKTQLARLRAHLKSSGFSDVKVKVYHGEAASRTDPDDPFVRQVMAAAKESFGKFTVNISNAGTGPMHSFAKILGAPCVSIGSTYVFSRIHSPNEFARLDLLKKATKCMCLIIDKFSAQPAN